MMSSIFASTSECEPFIFRRQTAPTEIMSIIDNIVQIDMTDIYVAQVRSIDRERPLGLLYRDPTSVVGKEKLNRIYSDLYTPFRPKPELYCFRFADAVYQFLGHQPFPLVII